LEKEEHLNQQQKLLMLDSEKKKEVKIKKLFELFKFFTH